MKKILLIFILGLLTCFYSCEESYDIQGRGDNLEERITALESKVDEINQNIRSLQTLHLRKDEVNIIYDISNIDKGFNIVLSDNEGTEIPIILDDVIEASIPLIGIDVDNYWVVSISGATALRMKDSNGDDIPVSGSDVDVLPKLKIDANGYWMVSYDEGADWIYLGDRNGDKIDAIRDNVTSSSSSFIKKYVYDEVDHILVLTLITDEVFTLQVYRAPTPVVEITNSLTSKPTLTTLSFSVKILNFDEWRYMYKEASEAAPSIDDIITLGTVGENPEGEETSVDIILRDLTSAVTYKVYAVAIQNPKIYSAISYAENTTVDQSAAIDYYAMYNNGDDITVGDIVVNKTNYPDGTVVTRVKPSEMTGASFTQGGILFIDNSNTNDLIFTSSSGIVVEKPLVIIGQYATPGSKQAEIKNSGFNCIQNIAIKNIKLTVTNANSLFFPGTVSSAPTLNVEDCSIFGGGSIVYESILDRSFGSINIHNSTIKLGLNKDFIVYNWRKEATGMLQLTSLKITNNVIYTEVSSTCYVLNFGAAGGVPASNMELVVKNNTIYNLWQANILIRSSEAKSVDISNNVCWYSTAGKNNIFSGFYAPANLPEQSVGVIGNYLYSTEAAKPWSLRHWGSVFKTQDALNFFGDTAPKDPIAASLNIADGYIPVNPSAVGDGMGADYETKHWINR